MVLDVDRFTDALASAPGFVCRSCGTETRAIGFRDALARQLSECQSAGHDVTAWGAGEAVTGGVAATGAA